jgi:hypothetical protein
LKSNTKIHSNFQTSGVPGIFHPSILPRKTGILRIPWKRPKSENRRRHRHRRIKPGTTGPANDARLTNSTQVACCLCCTTAHHDLFVDLFNTSYHPQNSRLQFTMKSRGKSFSAPKNGNILRSAAQFLESLINDEKSQSFLDEQGSFMLQTLNSHICI